MSDHHPECRLWKTAARREPVGSVACNCPPDPRPAPMRVRFLMADVAVPAGPRFAVHRVGWLPGEGWFCDCPARRTCPHITLVRQEAGK